MLSFSVHSFAQQELQSLVDGALDPDQRLQEIRNLNTSESEREQPRELNVLAPTIAIEEIDRAVVNKLMQEISNDPEITKTRLAASDAQLEDILIIISNARSFINNSEI